MRILAGLELGGAACTELDDLTAGHGSVGEVSFGPHQLLRDLELRLGLTGDLCPEAVRSSRWAARMSELAPLGRVYSKSFAVDALGTARALLRLRDALVEAGWDGQPIAGGGARLEALHELERARQPALPPGPSDRLAAVERALTSSRGCLYSEVALAESVERWPARWQTIFRGLERAGTRLTRAQVNLPGAPPRTDLGRIQAVLRLERGTAPSELVGDGSFVLLTAETSWEAARAIAAVLASVPSEHAVVIRGSDVSAFDNAFDVHGLRTQGFHSNSPWRSALQVLPLALELAFEPKDPYRVLELLTLPVGPFQGFSGGLLARALMQSPGIGSPAWVEAKARISSSAERGAELATRINDWLETPGADSVTGAPRSAVLGVVDRVRAWVLSRVAGSPEDPVLLTAARHANALRAAVDSDPRTSFNLVEVRALLESVLAASASVELLPECAGRIDHVDTPAAIRLPRGIVVWWPFVQGTTVHPRLPWRQRELAALHEAGLRFPDPGARLADEAKGWRSALCAATERVILVAPRSCAGSASRLHPFWDEIVARTEASDLALSRITCDARTLLEPGIRVVVPDRPALTSRAPAKLPGGHAEWSTPGGDVGPPDHFSPASLDALLGCPLQWVLHYRAHLRAGDTSLPRLFQLNGTLGHRLVERLYEDGGFQLAEGQLQERAETHLQQLFVQEGALLLRAGMAFERGQLERQLVRAVCELARTLQETGLQVVAVEEPIDVAWRSGRLGGRIDLLVRSKDGAQAIVDMKWGFSSYRDELRAGQALQLSVYAFALAAAGGNAKEPLPEAAYFSLKRSQFFGLPSRFVPHAEAIEGPSLEQTWRKVERAVERVERAVVDGRFPVTGLRGSPPLLEALQVPSSERENHFALSSEASCRYCGFDGLCGRRWEALQ